MIERLSRFHARLSVLFLDRSGHIFYVEELRFETDIAATTAASELLVERAPHYGAELWCRNRMVASFAKSIARQEDIHHSPELPHGLGLVMSIAHRQRAEPVRP